MIVHVFNSSIVSGPETLVIPSLSLLEEKVVVIFLSETRLGEKSDRPPAYSRSFGLETLEITVRSRWDRKAVAELGSLLKKLSPRIVHAHEVKASAYLAAASPQRPSYKLITTNHGVRAKKAPTLRFYEWIFTHLIMKKFDRVLCVCTSDRDLLIKRGVSADKVFTHLNGVDRPETQREKDSPRIRESWRLAELGIPGDAICLGIVGRLAPEKRHSFILKVLRKLIDLKPEKETHLIVFGTGALAEPLHDETRALHLEKNVHWMGYRAEIGAENAGFDILISLSSAEGLPINIIEAGWAGTSVLATSVDGNLDLIPSHDYGNLVSLDKTETEVAEILYKMISNPELLRNTGKLLQKRVKSHFSGKIWLERLKELYIFPADKEILPAERTSAKSK
jgi:glycosyltransferase involved in cell wall biosynthesis